MIIVWRSLDADVRLVISGACVDFIEMGERASAKDTLSEPFGPTRGGVTSI